jgi:enamine deaminase RidA (YjgF/YER057c/UK114 family)
MRAEGGRDGIHARGIIPPRAAAMRHDDRPQSPSGRWLVRHADGPMENPHEARMMTPQQRAESLGLTFSRLEPGYLNLCIRSGNLLITSGHVSDLKGKLGRDVDVQQGYAAARNCMEKILNSVWNAHGTLDGLRVLKLLGCVNSTLEFTEQHLVVNGASDLVHELYGKAGDGFHARSALGFAQLPTGAAVEVEAIFEIQG